MKCDDCKNGYHEYCLGKKCKCDICSPKLLEIIEYQKAMENWAKVCGEIITRLQNEQEEILRKLQK